MKLQLKACSGALLAAAAASAIALAPTASAGPCEVTGAGGGMEGGQTTVCESPGNVQIDSRPSVYPTEQFGGMFPWDDGMFVM
ncbi:MAG: hypothetical protein U0R77_01400 [Mycolicibacterium insubricum]|nr:hypothetical protein [Mycobacterium sp.]